MTSQPVLAVKQLHDYRTNILNIGEKNCSSSRLEFFSKIKENFVEEPFLDEVENYDVKKTSLNLGQATIPCLVKQEDITDQYFPEKNVYATFVKTME